MSHEVSLLVGTELGGIENDLRWAGGVGYLTAQVWARPQVPGQSPSLCPESSVNVTEALSIGCWFVCLFIYLSLDVLLGSYTFTYLTTLIPSSILIHFQLPHTR